MCDDGVNGVNVCLVGVCLTDQFWREMLSHVLSRSIKIVISTQWGWALRFLTSVFRFSHRLFYLSLFLF